MTESQKQRAVNLFVFKYATTPAEAGYSQIDYYKEKDMFVYSDSAEAIKAFMQTQNILTWVMRYFFGLMALCFGAMAWFLYELGVEPVVYALGGLAVCILFGIVLAVLGIICLINKKYLTKAHLFFISNEEYDDD